MEIKVQDGYQFEQEIQDLFTEYTDMLVQNDSSFENYLQLQNYDSELQNTQIKYGLPDGRLYLATVDGKAAGCIAMRKIDETACEMKRLYVRPEFRGLGLSYLLIKKLLSEARTCGYSTMYLDTLPFLESAIHLYKKYGFCETECYNNSPMSSTIYMKYDLS